MLHIPRPKGAAKRSFDIPLSREMILCLIRVIRVGRQMYPTQTLQWIFPADSASGHLIEQKEDREILSKWGNDLRQSFRTIAAAAGVSEFDARLLINHAIPGVNAGYITRHKLLENHLRAQQQAISSATFAGLGDALTENRAVRAWLRPAAAKPLPSAANAERSEAERPLGQHGGPSGGLTDLSSAEPLPHPEFARQLAHSSVVKSWRSWLMARQMASTVRAAAFQKKCLSLAKTCPWD
jgi:hypothetical protein